MRWIWSTVVALCLVAAGGRVDDLRVSRSAPVSIERAEGATLDRAVQVAPSIIAVRHLAPRGTLSSLIAALVPIAPALFAPPRSSYALAFATPDSNIGRDAPARSCRGPPVG